jgi:hypothetical protein
VSLKSKILGTRNNSINNPKCVPKINSFAKTKPKGEKVRIIFCFSPLGLNFFFSLSYPEPMKKFSEREMSSRKKEHNTFQDVGK